MATTEQDILDPSLTQEDREARPAGPAIDRTNAEAPLSSLDVLAMAQGVLAIPDEHRRFAGRTDRLVHQLNQDTFLAPVGGKVMVYSRQPDSTRVEDLATPGRAPMVFVPMATHEWVKLHENVRVEFGTYKDGTPRLIGLGTAWLKHEARRQYGGVGYWPGDLNTDGVLYNLWEGFSVRPAPGEKHLRWLEHLHQNICNGNSESANYLWKLFADAVQNPGTPWTVAPVMRGAQGTGKGVLASPMLESFGPHGLHMHGLSHFLGRFSGHLAARSFLYVDEAFWGGSKEAVGRLKGLITDDMLMIERKFMDAVAQRNTLHVLLASNEAWVVPVGEHERRFFVLDVGEAHMQDHNYFGRIAREMKDGGTANLLHALLTTDLSGFSPAGDVPRTAALATQRAFSLSPIEEWWYDLLRLGERPARDFTAAGEEISGRTPWEGQTAVGVKLLQQDFQRWQQDGRRPGEHSVATMIGQLLSRVLPGGAPRKQGRRPDEVYVIPSLEDARRGWEAAQGGRWTW